MAESSRRLGKNVSGVVARLFFALTTKSPRDNSCPAVKWPTNKRPINHGQSKRHAVTVNGSLFESSLFARSESKFWTNMKTGYVISGNETLNGPIGEVAVPFNFVSIFVSRADVII